MNELQRTRPAAPVRALHMGLGSFFRAHQAWYTHHAADGGEWGIAAFTGRSARMAETLGLQDGLYTLDVRAPEGDRYELIESLSAVHAAGDRAAWAAYWADPAVVLVTLTVTEAGYRRAAGGGLDLTDADVQQDLIALQTGRPADVRTAPAQLVAGFLARREAGAGALTIVPCDNLPGNGPALAAVVDELVSLVDDDLAAWAREHISYASTAVDRITPATTDEDRARVEAALGVTDRSPVVTEPFVEWVISGNFPAGRPAWETAGATIVPDTAPYEARKLTLLNGSHSLMAYAGPLRGHATVNEAIADEVVRGWVDQWWDEACRHLPLAEDVLAHYREALLERYANPMIQHKLAQIAMDGSLKLPVRILPTIRAERAAGRVPTGAARVLAAWTLSLRTPEGPADPRRAELVELAQGGPAAAVPRLLAALDPALAEDADLVAAVRDLAEQLARA